MLVSALRTHPPTHPPTQPLNFPPSYIRTSLLLINSSPPLQAHNPGLGPNIHANTAPPKHIHTNEHTHTHSDNSPPPSLPHKHTHTHMHTHIHTHMHTNSTHTHAIKRIQVSPSLMAALLKHCELKGVWKVKGAEGFGNWWATCTEVSQWESMRNLNLSYCSLPSIPSTVGELKALRILRLSHNKWVCTVGAGCVSEFVCLVVFACVPSTAGKLKALRFTLHRHSKRTLYAACIDLNTVPGL